MLPDKHKWIKGYEEKYSCTMDGLVYSHKKSGGIKPVGSQGVNGYIQLNLSKDGIKEFKLAHRIIAETFIPNPDALPNVDHIDEDKTNNKVSNLRWCSHQQNMEYYNTKDGRDYHLLLQKEHRKFVRQSKVDMARKQRELDKAEAQILKLTKELEDKQAKFKEYVDKENTRIIVAKQNYNGYMDTSGMRFDNMQNMIASTGKQIVVDGTQFISCGTAASWIVEQEELLGLVRSKDTISKELRKYLQGRRPAWTMYDRYSIGS